MCNDAEKPSPVAREELQELIKTRPAYKEAIQKQEGLYPVALSTRVEGINSSDSFKEVLYVKCEKLREELGYSSANQLERLAINQIVLCWLNHHQIEILHANKLSQ